MAFTHGEMLKHLRSEQGMNQFQLASAVDRHLASRRRFGNVSTIRQAISQFENGRRTIPYLYRDAFAIVFDIPPDWFVKAWTSERAFASALRRHRSTWNEPNEGNNSKRMRKDTQDISAPIFDVSRDGVIGVSAISGNASLAKDSHAVSRHAITKSRVSKAATLLHLRCTYQG